jgi:AcrR family transcriptional regulator
LTRQRIVESACACFGQRGYATTTNQDIAEGAGVTPAAIYQYFDSKKALYLEAVRSAHRLILPYFRDAVAGHEAARGAFRDLARAYAVAHDRHPSVTPLLSALPVEMRRHAEIAEAMASGPLEFSDIVQDLTARAVASGELAADLSEGTASMLLACTMGLSLHASLMGKARFESAVEAFARLLDGSLLAKPEAMRAAIKKARAR